MLLGLLDAALALALLMIPIVLLGRFRLALGPATLSAQANAKAFVVPLLLAVSRLAIARGTGVAGLWERPAFARPIVCALDSLAFLLLLALPLAWILDPWAVESDLVTFTVPWSWRLAASLAAAVSLRTLLVCGRLSAGGWLETALFRKLSLSLITAYGFVAMLEGVLALAGVEAVRPQVVFADKTAAGATEFRYYTPDPDLGFRLDPGTVFAGRQINNLGFRDREVDPVKKPGAIRVICLGDSVTAQGCPGYAFYLNESLGRDPPTTNAWEAFIMAVHSYSSLQGLRLFQKRGAALKPDLVTLYFGWNDHWLMSCSDRERLAFPAPSAAGRLWAALRGKRIVAFAARLRRPARPSDRIAAPVRQDEDGPWRGRVLRVPPEEYRATLTMLVSEIRRSGALPLLITAPRRALSGELVERLYARSLEEAEQLHDLYTAITREVARETGANLLDLADILSGPECDSLFAPDGIHFDHYPQESRIRYKPVNQPGLQRVAAELDRKIRDLVASPAWQARTRDRGAGSP